MHTLATAYQPVTSFGVQLWSAQDTTVDWNYFSLDLDTVGYGKLFYYGYSGIVYCYDTKDGNLLWTYGNGGEGNSTDSGFETAYGRYPLTTSVLLTAKSLCAPLNTPPTRHSLKGQK